MSPETISIISALIAGLSALYARWAVKEAKKANELNRFNALLQLKSKYLEVMDSEIKKAKDWGNSNDGFTQACRDAFTEADTKHREVCKELEKYHNKLTNNQI